MDKLGQEWVSAAVDGELDEHTLAELAADADSHEQWRDYHMIGDAMRGELPQTVSVDLSDSIMAAIEDEPAILVPKQATQKSTAKSTSKVVPLFKQFGQYAIAATVAVVAVVGVQNYNQETLLNNSPLPVLNTRPLIGNVSPVSLQTGTVQPNQSFTNEQFVDQRRRINAYIQDHMLQQRLNTSAVIGDNSQIDTAPVNQ
ncbi:RseA family anti-sigma factor [Shewanella sp.]|nr:RseA family anti-sigma factor [Shewanella sp.]